MNNTLAVPQGNFQLCRIPHQTNTPLRAWDAADEYLLNYLYEQNLTAQTNILILNDSFGALAVALHQYQPIAMSDSYVSQLATRSNLNKNQVAETSVALLNSLNTPEAMIDVLLIKIPKTLALLEDQLYRVRPRLRADCKIIVAGMIKNLPASIWQILERMLGSTSTSLAIKKARLIFVSLDNTISLAKNPYPTSYLLENTNILLSNHANVFSREQLDIGSRFLLQHLPNDSSYKDIIDLGCGNGVIGLVLAGRLKNARIHFVDESHMAIASAQENFLAAYGNQQRASFTLANGLEHFPDLSADCVVCNPPFHQQHAIGDHIAQQMFKLSLKVLRNRGELRVIGNRHLQYHQSLQRLFGNCETVASNNKFMILQSFKMI